MNQVLERKESDSEVNDDDLLKSLKGSRMTQSDSQGFKDNGVADGFIPSGGIHLLAEDTASNNININTSKTDPLLPFDSAKSAEYILYPYRHLILLVFSLSASLNQICWISLQPVATTVANAYDVSTGVVNTISLVYMGVYLIMNFPSNYVLDRYGCRVGVSYYTLMILLR